MRPSRVGHSICTGFAWSSFRGLKDRVFDMRSNPMRTISAQIPPKNTERTPELRSSSSGLVDVDSRNRGVDLERFIRGIQKRWPWCAGVGIPLAILVGMLGWHLGDAKYSATAIVEIKGFNNFVIEPSPESAHFMYLNAQAEAVVFPSVLRQALEQPEVLESEASAMSSRRLASLVTTEVNRSSELMKISVLHHSAETAQLLANFVASSYIVYANRSQETRIADRLKKLEAARVDSEVKLQNSYDSLRAIGEEIGTIDYASIALRRQIELESKRDYSQQLRELELKISQVASKPGSSELAALELEQQRMRDLLAGVDERLSLLDGPHAVELRSRLRDVNLATAEADRVRTAQVRWQIEHGSQQRVSLQAQAELPMHPDTGRRKRAAAVCGAVSFGLILLFIGGWEWYSSSRATAHNLAESGFDVLGVISHQTSTNPSTLDEHSLQAGSMAIGTRIVHRLSETEHALVLLTWSGNQQTQDLTAWQLANALACQGKQVLLGNVPGLSELGRSGIVNFDLPHPFERNGHTPGGVSVLCSKQLRVTDHGFSQTDAIEVLTQLREEHDVVLVNVPKSANFNVLFHLADVADAAIVVVREGKTPMSRVQAELHRLNGARLPSLGIVSTDDLLTQHATHAVKQSACSSDDSPT